MVFNNFYLYGAKHTHYYDYYLMIVIKDVEKVCFNGKVTNIYEVVISFSYDYSFYFERIIKNIMIFLQILKIINQEIVTMLIRQILKNHYPIINYWWYYVSIISVIVTDFIGYMVIIV